MPKRKQCSITEIKEHLSSVIQEVEGGTRVVLTRRGTPVAVLLQVADYEQLAHERLTQPARDFGEWLEKFRREHAQELEELWAEGDPFEGIREQSPDEDYERLANDKGGYGEALARFRREADLEAIWADGDPFEGVRDKSPGRDFSW